MKYISLVWIAPDAACFAYNDAYYYSSKLIQEVDTSDKKLKSLDSAEGNQINLSLDKRVQEIMHKALTDSIETFNAIGASGVVMHAKTGEVLSLVSLPDFNPNHKINEHSENNTLLNN